VSRAVRAAIRKLLSVWLLPKTLPRRAAQSNGIRQEQPALAQLAGNPHAHHKINRCLMFLHALPFFGLGTLLAARVLATTCLPPLPPAACEHVHDHTNTCHIDALGPHGHRRRWRVPGRAVWGVWPGAKSTRFGERKYFLCYVN
jgi:hypothetical protein